MSRTRRVLLIIENVSLARDHRARKQITSLLSAGYRVGLICRRDEQNAGYRPPGLELYEYPAPPERSGKAFFVFEYAYSLIAALVLMFRARADGAVHAIQSGQPPDTYFLATLPAKLLGTRLVVDQRDLSPEVYADRFGKRGGPIASILRALERASWRSADHVITVNGSLVKAVATRGSVSRERVTAVGNGPMLSAIDGRESDERLREGFPHLVCWLGVMGPQDHAELGLRAVSHYVHRLGRKDALFVFIGEGEAMPGLQQLASQLEIKEFVRFTGWLSEDACFRYLATADVGLDTNLQPEVTPVKGLEYMAHSIPFVAFDLPETRVLAADAARYATPGNAEELARAVASLLDAPDDRRRIGRIGRERIEREHAWDCQQGHYLRVYDQLIPKTAGRVSVRDRFHSRARSWASEHQSIYLPFARKKYPGPSPEVIGPTTEVVIDGYTRAGSTFAVYAFQLAQERPVRMAHHLHAPAQLIAAAKAGLPTIAVIRDPEEATLSQVVREPNVSLEDALWGYARFYSCLLRYQPRFVVADFDEITTNFGAVTKRLNARFGTSYGEFEHTAENVERCLALMKERSKLPPQLLAFESGTATLAEAIEALGQSHRNGGEQADAWVPSAERSRDKKALRELLASPRLDHARQRALDVYARFSRC